MSGTTEPWTSRLLVRQARADFDRRRPDPDALATLARTILAAPLPDASDALDGLTRPLVTEQLAAGVEYLDGTVRMAPELVDIDTVRRLAKELDRAGALLRDGDPLRVGGQLLSASVSLAMLGGRPAWGSVDPGDHPHLVHEARALLGLLEERSATTSVTATDIWTLRVVGDALDLAHQPDGRSWMRLADRCQPGSPWPRRLQERLRFAEVQADGGRPTLVARAARLGPVAHTWNNVGDLPEVAALQSRRERYGRGLIGEHRRARELLNGRVWPLAAVLLGSVLLAFAIAWGRPLLAGQPSATRGFALDLPAGEALAMSTALLAVAGTVAVALAVLIRPEPTVALHYEMARRWWNVGTVLILLCGMISTSIGVLEALSHDQRHWWATGLTIVIGLLHFLLAFGITQWRDEPRLRAWTERYNLDSLQTRLQGEQVRLRGRPEPAWRFWLRGLALAGVFAVPVAAVVTSCALSAARVAPVTVAAIALVTGLGSALPALALVRIAVEWRRLRLTDPRGRTAQLSLAMPSAGLCLFLPLPALVGLLAVGGTTWPAVAGLTAAYGVFLLVLVRSVWSRGWPTRFIRRRALQLAERMPGQLERLSRNHREG